MMLICRVLSCNWKGWLADIGRYTLAIYGLQGVLLQNVVERIWSIDENICSSDVQQYVVAPVVGVITVIVCYLLARLFTRTRITAQLFLGISGPPGMPPLREDETFKSWKTDCSLTRISLSI